jgi:sarcosine oxidase subunit delta
MKLLTCPLNGARNIEEFQYLGPIRATPDPDATSDGDWAVHLFAMPNSAGVLREWWRHRASNYVFVAERHCVTDTVLRTYDPSELEAGA